MPNFKPSGGFKMKSPALMKATKGGPIHQNYGSPMKDYSVGKGSHEHPHSPAKNYGSPMKEVKKMDILGMADEDRKNRTDARNKAKTGTKTYDQAYDALSEDKKASYRNEKGDKGSGRKAFKAAASTYNKDTYKTDNPTKVAKSRKMDKKTLAKDVKAQKGYDANDKARTEAANKNTENNNVKIKAKSDEIKAGNKTAKTKERTKVGKIATRIANKFRKNKVDPNRTKTKVEKNKTKLAKSREKAMNKDSKRQARKNK